MPTVDCPSSKFVDFGTNRKRVYDLLLVLDRKRSAILTHFTDIRALYAESHFFRTQPLFRSKFRVFPLE